MYSLFSVSLSPKSLSGRKVVYKQRISLFEIHLLTYSAYGSYKGYKNISCPTQPSMKFFLVINVKMPIVVGILTFMSRKKCILGLYKPKNAEFLDIFYPYEHLKFKSQLS